MRDYITEVAASLGDAPPSMVGLPVLGFAAGTIGNRRVLAVKRRWREGAILWCGVISRTGTAKTPAQEAARHPVRLMGTRRCSAVAT